jgi:UDP-glucose:(heptosyl)LPS alpha-1,3-glucosyltransferase
MKIALSFIGCHGRGGVERLILETANFLAKRHHQVHVYASEFDSAALHAEVVRHLVPTVGQLSLGRLLTYTYRSRIELARLEPQADVHGAFGVISPPGGVVNVQSVHRAWLETSRSLRDFTGRLRQRCNPSHPFILTLERDYFGKRHYKQLVAPSPQVKAELIRYYSVPGEDIVIVPNGFSPEALNFTRSEALRCEMRGKLGYRDDDVVVLFVANELERKGFGPLLRAIATLKNRHLHLLAVVGRANPDRYLGESRRLGLGARVQITGSKGDLAPYYAVADTFALPTQYEPWGLVIVEALACGARVLTSRLAGAALAVREGETGELLDNPTDVDEIAAKLDHLCHNGHFGRKEVAASVQRFTWDNVLKDYERVLEDARALC